MVTRATLFGYLLLIKFIDYVCSECPNGWVTYEDSCYVHPRSNLTFQEAEELCRHFGAHLVHIETALENNFLKSYVSDSQEPGHWIGLRDEIIEGQWEWYDTDTITNYTDWADGEPNGDHGSNCVLLWKTYKFKWADDPCSHLYSPLCEKRNVKQQCHCQCGSEVVG